MTVKYLDPYKNDPYGKLRGEKQNEYFTVEFDEAKIHPLDNGYMIAANVVNYIGVERNFKPELDLEPGFCAIPIYNKEYEIRAKVNGEYINQKFQPSKYEKALCQFIEDNTGEFLTEGHGIKGTIVFIPEGMTTTSNDAQMRQMVETNCQVERMSLTGKLPEYTPPSAYQRKGSSSSYSRGASPEDKLAVIKKELTSFAVSSEVSDSDSLGKLVKQIVNENIGQEAFLALYFDTLQAVVK